VKPNPSLCCCALQTPRLAARFPLATVLLLPCLLAVLLGQYRLATAAGLKPDDVKQWLTANGLFQALFDRRSTHNELLKRSGDVIRFAASTGMLSLEYVFCIASFLLGTLTTHVCQTCGLEAGVLASPSIAAPPPSLSLCMCSTLNGLC
jgi:hypothetical protein